MRVIRLAAALVLAGAAAGACSSGDGASPRPTVEGATTAPTTAADRDSTPAASTDDTAGAPDETTTSFDAEATGDAIALGEALGYDLTNDDAACIKRTVGDSTVALLDENDIGALPAEDQGDLFQSLVTCAAGTVVQDSTTALPGSLGITEEQATCVGQAYVTIYGENRKAAEQAARSFADFDADVQSYVRSKLGACLPADKLDELLGRDAG